MAKVKKNGRFDGLSEEEVKKKDSLPDYLESDLDIVFVGINPSLMAAHKGRYYAGPGNHFYKLLHASELVPKFVSFEEDCQLIKYKIGLTNIVERATRSSADLTKIEIKEGCRVVAEKLKLYKPKIAVFNGKCIYQVFAESLNVKKFDFGIQLKKIEDTAIWVVPSSSARCSNFPRMNDKLHFYQAIKRHLKFLKGEIEDANIKDYYFGGKCTQPAPAPKRLKKEDNVLNNRATEYCPQFVVMEIHDGSNKNNSQQSENLGNNSDEEKEFLNIEDEMKSSGTSANDGRTLSSCTSNSQIPNDVEENNLSKDCENEKANADNLSQTLKRKYVDEKEVNNKQKEIKKLNPDIQKSLERFMYKKKS